MVSEGRHLAGLIFKTKEKLENVPTLLQINKNF